MASCSFLDGASAHTVLYGFWTLYKLHMAGQILQTRKVALNKVSAAQSSLFWNFYIWNYCIQGTGGEKKKTGTSL